MTTSEEIDKRAKELAKLLDETDINDIGRQMSILKNVHALTKQYEEWVKQNGTAE